MSEHSREDYVMATAEVILDELLQLSYRQNEMVTTNDLREMLWDIRNSERKKIALFGCTAGKLAQGSPENVLSEHNRSMAFDRILIGKISFLLSSEADDLKRPDRLSRCVLPGLFHALRELVGDMFIEHYQYQCAALMAELKGRDEGAFDWLSLYTDARSETIVNEALIGFAAGFHEFDNRMDWFVETVNSRLNPDQCADWRFSRENALELLDTLFFDLSEQIDDPERCAEFEAKFGRVLMERLRSTFETLKEQLAHIRLHYEF